MPQKSLNSLSTTLAKMTNSTFGVGVWSRHTYPIVRQESVPIVGQESVPLVGQESVPAVGQESVPAVGQESVPTVGQEGQSDIWKKAVLTSACISLSLMHFPGAL